MSTNLKKISFVAVILTTKSRGGGLKALLAGHVLKKELFVASLLKEDIKNVSGGGGGNGEEDYLG